MKVWQQMQAAVVCVKLQGSSEIFDRGQQVSLCQGNGLRLRSSAGCLQNKSDIICLSEISEYSLRSLDVAGKLKQPCDTTRRWTKLDDWNPQRPGDGIGVRF